MTLTGKIKQTETAWGTADRLEQSRIGKSGSLLNLG